MMVHFMNEASEERINGTEALPLILQLKLFQKQAVGGQIRPNIF